MASVFDDAFEIGVDVLKAGSNNTSKYITRDLITVNPDSGSHPTTDSSHFQFTHNGLTTANSSSPPRLLNVKNSYIEVKWTGFTGVDVDAGSAALAAGQAFLDPNFALSFFSKYRLTFNDAVLEDVSSNTGAIGSVKAHLKGYQYWLNHMDYGLFVAPSWADGSTLEAWSDELMITSKCVRIPLWLLTNAFDGPDNDFFLPCRSLTLDAIRAPILNWTTPRANAKQLRTLTVAGLTTTMYLEYVSPGIDDMIELKKKFSRGMTIPYYSYDVDSKTESITTAGLDKSLQISMRGANAVYPIISQRSTTDSITTDDAATVGYLTVNPAPATVRPHLQDFRAMTVRYRGKERPNSTQVLKTPYTTVASRQYHTLYELYRQRLGINNKELTGNSILTYTEFYNNPLICIPMSDSVAGRMPVAEPDRQPADITIDTLSTPTSYATFYTVVESLRQVSFDSNFEYTPAKMY